MSFMLLSIDFQIPFETVKVESFSKRPKSMTLQIPVICLMLELEKTIINTSYVSLSD